MFHLAPPCHPFVPEAMLSALMSAKTNKLKFVVCPRFHSTNDVPSGSEILLAAYSYQSWTPIFFKMLPEILNKRWQTVDLKAMMSELHWSSSEIMITLDTLKSVHRFKRKESASLS